MRSIRVLLFFAGAVAIGAASGCSKDPITAARDYLASANRYAEQKQYEAAIIEYKNAIKAKPDLAEAHYKLAQVYEASGDPRGAYGSYTRAADLQPSNIDAQLKAGSLLLAAGAFERFSGPGVDQQERPPAGPRIAAAGAVGVEVDFRRRRGA